MRRAMLAIGVLVVGLAFWVFGRGTALPAVTGPYAVGLRRQAWVDTARPEVMTVAADDVREVPVVIWYPAQTATGRAGAYFPGLEAVAADLAASGDVSPLEVALLPYVHSAVRVGADVAAGVERYPVLVFSPGNASNIEFYAALAADLASWGYVVVGVNHPYDAAAVALSDGRVARYDNDAWPMDRGARQAIVAGRIAVRTADVQFALAQLAALDTAGHDALSGRLDWQRVGVLGHSLGGITAAQACLADLAIGACLNLDGLQAGGPFAAEGNPTLPEQPFMFFTKEAQLAPAVTGWLAALPGGGYTVTLSGATHDSFSDGPALLAGLLPWPTPAVATMVQVRAYTRAFFDETLRGQAGALVAGPAGGGVRVTIYPGG